MIAQEHVEKVWSGCEYCKKTYNCDKSTIPGSAWKLTKRGAIRAWDSRWLPYGKEKTDGMDT